MKKIILSDEQIALLKKINAPYSPETDYDDDAVIELEDAITDYAVGCVMSDDDEEISFGDQLLDLHAFIIDKYDS